MRESQSEKEREIRNTLRELREGSVICEHRAPELGRAICDLPSTIYDEGQVTTRRGKQASDDDDEEERATATTSEHWGFFGLVLVQRLCIGFLFFF